MHTPFLGPYRSISDVIDELEQAGYIHPIKSVANTLYHNREELVGARKGLYDFIIDEDDLRVNFYMVDSACGAIKGYLIEP